MRALLDTNIIIHRENKKISNYSIGHLYRWLDKLGYTKLIHPYSISEIQKYKDSETQEAFAVKLDAYEEIKTIVEPSKDVLDLIAINDRNENDKVDNYLLNEVFLGRVDILITEDRKLRGKADKLGISDKVLSINQFISVATMKNPDLVSYKMLAVEKSYFGIIDIKNPFFDSFKRDYREFEKWYNSKCDEEAYVCRSDNNSILGFLFLKTENATESYNDIFPTFEPKKRLKVGTFKVESTGFRLGERFIKIIFDNALQRNVDEIYVTLFTQREELRALENLLKRWGFYYHGVKRTLNGEETVLVKKLKEYNKQFSVRENYPNLLYSKQKFILPIFGKYHTTLLPDSKLNNENEVDFLEKIPHRYALQKVYISWADARNVNLGDLIIFYRMGEDGSNKKYTSVLSTVGVVSEVLQNFRTKEDFLKHCQNRSVFSDAELESFWSRQRTNLTVLKFIYVKSLTKRIPLKYLWDNGIVQAPSGPRSFMKLTDTQFDAILSYSETEIKYTDNC